MAPERSEFRLANRRVWVAGHRGMVGAALVRRLASEECETVAVGRDALDLRRQAEVEDWMAETRPEVVVVAAARVGGILANHNLPGDFLYDNLTIATNVIEASRRLGVAKLLFLGSSCIYPGRAPQPISENALLTGPLEPTNEWYAVAKIAGVKLCQALRRQHGCDFITAMPTNLYGPGDNFELETGHVLPALMAKAHAAKRAAATAIEVWGTGSPRREFLYVDDLADALVHLLKVYSAEAPVNLGCGEDVTIAGLARLICETVGFEGELRFDTTRPDGAPRKLLDVSRLAALGWWARTSLGEGLALTYAWYLDHIGGDAPRSDRATV